MSAQDGCHSCGEQCCPPNECPKSKRSCGHHCNCSWTQDVCCWCGEEFECPDEVETPGADDEGELPRALLTGGPS